MNAKTKLIFLKWVWAVVEMFLYQKNIFPEAHRQDLLEKTGELIEALKDDENPTGESSHG